MRERNVKTRSTAQEQRKQLESVFRSELIQTPANSSTLSFPITLFSFNDIQMHQLLSSFQNIFSIADVSE